MNVSFLKPSSSYNPRHIRSLISSDNMGLAEGVWNISRSRGTPLEAVRLGCRLTKWNSTIQISFSYRKRTVRRGV
jgi:hypothetical protein